jgi:hypothetical protein
MKTQLIDAVEEDTSLLSYEKETIIKFSKVDDCASVYTEQARPMRQFIQHPHFEVKSLRVNVDDADGKRVAPTDFEKGSIIGVDGTIPREALILQTSL